ncbi:hypothetical protein [Thermaerobacillus caldiproteolyticus]|nr:hypothetical protein [Anoxybacillus caldiproteolyticus]
MKNLKKLLAGIAIVSALVAGVTFASGDQASSSIVAQLRDPGDIG